MNDTKKLSGLALIGAPLLMLSADTISLIFEYPEYFWFVSVLMFLSFFAFIGLIHGVYNLSNRSTLATVGAVLATLGTLAGASIMGLERVAWAMQDSGLSAEIGKTVNHPFVFYTSRAIGITFPVGLIILSICLYKSKVLNGILTFLLILGILLFPIGRIALGAIANVPGDLILLIIYGKLGVNLLHGNTG